MATARRREDTDVLGFIEHFAAVMTGAGMPRMPSRVFAALLATDSGRLTAGELATLLDVSPAAVSGAVRYLVQVNLARRERDRGSRRDVYVVRDDVWYEAILQRDELLRGWEESARLGVGVLGAETRAGARMADSLRFFQFLRAELPAMLERWRSLREEPTGGATQAAPRPGQSKAPRRR
jgi:DNA-binding transcriptional ArsR family regulator